MAGVTDRQIEEARAVDLADYLRMYEPGELKKDGPNQYRTASHDSLVISNGKWHWFSRDIGGKGALDYLIKVKGMDFLSAVQVLSSGDIAVTPPEAKHEPDRKPQKLILPQKSPYSMKVMKYLMDRGIDGEIIRRCLEDGSLYESLPHHNCVFVGRDQAGKVRFAAMRGTYGSFKMDVPGSDKRFGFCLKGNGGSEMAAVFESAIDALSGATLRKLSGQDWEDSHYLSLGGTSPLALMQFLKDHGNVSTVLLCLDNDTAGRLGAERIAAEIAESGFGGQVKRIEDLPPPAKHGKDYNEHLTGLLAETRRQNRRPPETER